MAALKAGVAAAASIARCSFATTAGDVPLRPGKGPGDVDQKKIGDRAGWGNLPPAQRQEALQRLTEELPSHYREVIEGYFRQLAKDNSR